MVSKERAVVGQDIKRAVCDDRLNRNGRADIDGIGNLAGERRDDEQLPIRSPTTSLSPARIGPVQRMMSSFLSGFPQRSSCVSQRTRPSSRLRQMSLLSVDIT